MLKTKIVSNLEKVFMDDDIDSFKALDKMSALRGERIAFQLVCQLDTPDFRFPCMFSLKIDGALAKYTTVRRIGHVPANAPARGKYDEDFLKWTPGLFPDVLAPMQYNGKISLPQYEVASFWIEIDIPADCKDIGESELSLYLERIKKHEDSFSLTASEKISIELVDAELPEQTLIFAQWFHSDCLANYYRVEKWSDEHFKIIENFARVAKKNGFRMILTPIVTPPLDNAYDTRDLQLANVTKTGENYTFNWDNLTRWLDMCDRVGIEFLEIGHLFTQGGAAYATKVMGTVDGEYKRLFASDTPCDDPEYTRFLRELLTSFLSYMKARGDDKRCYFHISDEPNDTQLETYKKAKESVADLLEGYPIMDALSHYEFYEKGVVEKPIVLLSYLADFIEHDVKGLWTYNCCAPDIGYSNRFMGMTLSRNRSISLLLYKYNIEGFLHWGYNFYNNSGSCDCINPYLDTSAGGCFPSGDAFSVYPADNGEALESTRLVTFTEALQDIRAYRLCESLYSREEVIAVLEEEIGGEIKPNTYINDSEKMHHLRERINSMIKAKLSKQKLTKGEMLC